MNLTRRAFAFALESACAQGTASIEECFGPRSDQDGNGIADVNE